MSKPINIASFKSLTDAEIANTTKLNITDYVAYCSVNIIDLTPFTNLLNLDINTNCRILIKGLNKCISLKSLNVSMAKFDVLENESLESFCIHGLYEDVFDPTGCPNLRSISISSSTKCDVSKISELKYLERCNINCKAFGTIKSNTITFLHNGCNSNIVYDLPNLESYSGTFNVSILTNPNVKTIAFEEEELCDDITDDLVANLPNLTELALSLACIDIYNIIAKGSKLTKLTLYTDNSGKIDDCIVNNSVITLDITGSTTIDISKVAVKFPCVEDLHICFYDDGLGMKKSVDCPLKKLVIDNCTINISDLKRFNTSNLSVLNCYVCDYSNKKLNIPTLTELYCNQFILVDENAANLKIYHGPVPTNVSLINIEEIKDEYSAYINVESMPKLRLVNGYTVDEYITLHKPEDAEPITEQIFEQIFEQSVKEVIDINPIDRNINMLLSNYRLSFDDTVYENNNMNGSYFYVKNDLVKIDSEYTFELVVGAIMSKSIKLDDEYENNSIVAKMNEIFKRHVYDDSHVILENLFIALDGKLGIIMDVSKYEMKKKLEQLQQQLDELKNRIA